LEQIPITKDSLVLGDVSVGFAYDETNQGNSPVRRCRNIATIKIAMALVLETLLEQLFHRGLRQLLDANIDIQADLESQLHEKLLKNVHAKEIRWSLNFQGRKGSYGSGLQKRLEGK
jgi:hypothetical protein